MAHAPRSPGGETMLSVKKILVDQMWTEYRERQEGEKGPPRRFYDSGAGSCTRQRVLKRAGMEEALPWSDDLEVMESGNFYHAAHAARLKRAGALAVDEEGTTMSEYALKDEHTSGRLDFLVRHEGELCLVDLKTTAQSSFEYRKRENAAQPHHMMQLCRYYLKLAGTQNKPDFGMIVYI